MTEKENVYKLSRLRKRKEKCYNESDDSEEHEEVIKKIKKSKSPLIFLKRIDEENEEEEEETGPTDYELQRLRNIEERRRLFQELQIGEAKEELQAVAVKKKKVSPKIKRVIEPRSKSLRLQQKTPNGEPLPEMTVPVRTLKSAVNSVIARKPSGPLPMKSAIDNEGHEEMLKSVVGCLDLSLEDKTSANVKLDCELEKFRKELCKLTLSEERIAKVVPYRIYSMAVHPTESKILLATGDKWGNLGFWDVLSKNGSESVELFQPHAGPLNCLSFSKYDPKKIYSTSHDGTVRCGDMNKLVFDEIYSSDEKLLRNHTTWHCEVEESCLMISHGNGQLALVDSRCSNEPQDWFPCHARSIRTVQLHPIQQQYFITSSSMCEVRIWDRRHIKKTSPSPICELAHPKGLACAFFSPAGKYALTTCNDDRLRVYDVTNMLSVRPNVVTSIKHNTHTGQWLTSFKATWHPQRDDVFVVGSMEYPRKIHVYSSEGEVIHKLKNENLASVCSINLFHPTQQVIFGGNSSGRVHVFM